MYMMFPKPIKKKRKKHKKSIMQPKGDRRCYLCMLLDGDFTYKPYLEEHHVLFGNTHAFAEAEGLKVKQMGRSIYFTDLEIEKLIDYVSDSVELLGEAEGTWEQTAEDMENGLGSAIRKLYKGRRGEKIYAKYKTKRGKGKRSNF